MKLYIKGKYIYLMMLAVITLLGIVIVPTYAKFTHSQSTENDIVGINMNFDIKISGIDQYEEIEVLAGNSYEFNVDISNNTDSTLYYGVWYKMVIPNKMPNDETIEIGKIKGTTTNTNGTIASENNTIVSVGIVNKTSSTIKIYIGVNSSSTNVGDIEYTNGKKLITGTVDEINDIYIANIYIDGEKSDSLPTSGYYEMSYTCAKGSTLSWNGFKKILTYESGSYVKDSCDVMFNSNVDYPLLNQMEVGSYVKYIGNNGCDSEHCDGTNANYVSDSDMGYCHDSASARYTSNGWRIAYIKDGSAHLISGGAPECMATLSDGSISATSGDTSNYETTNG